MSDEARKVGVVPATLMVAGNIMGSGVFMLPANLAATGGIAIFGWVVTIIGAIALALIYAKHSSIDGAAGGQYAYIRKAFGNFLGYQTNAVYWLAAWIGNVAMVVVGVGYVSYFIPELRSPWGLAGAGIFFIWLFTFINIIGPSLTTRVQSVAVILAMVPILGVAIFGWFFFSGDLYMESWNVSGKSAIGAVQGTLNVTLWAFIGVETASVAAGVVRDPRKNVPIATVGGVLIAAVTYILSCTAIMGIVPNAELAASDSPFGLAVKVALGADGGWWAGAIVAFCAAAGCLGSLGGWTLVVGQTAKAAADDGLFPRIFAQVNKAGVPYKGLIIVAVMMTVIQLASMSPSASKEFGVVSSISVIMTLVPYLYTSAALLLLAMGHYGHSRLFWHVTIVVAIVYSGWAILGSNAEQNVWAFLVILLTSATYALNERRKPVSGGSA